jgi:hypothetical protein
MIVSPSRPPPVDELAGLAAALGVSVAALLDPIAGDTQLDIGGTGPLPPPIARPFILDAQLTDERARDVGSGKSLASGYVDDGRGRCR